MYHFDVLTEAWIPAVRPDGSGFSCGVLELLEHAHELSEISCDSPLETYAVQRFLIAFLMDAYRLKRLKDRKNLYERGSFDMRVINDYIDLCRSEGVSFDLFDKERPFMQARYEAELDDGKIKYLANIFHYLPSGNNHVHFDHKTEEDRWFEFSECIRGILAAQIFAVSMTQGYPSSVNDTPCYYVLLEDDNLFHKLVLNMLSVGECQNMDYDFQSAAWRDHDPVIPKAEYADVSVLAGLTWQPRRITLIPDGENRVRQMYYQQGRSFHPNGKWIDPHVSFAINKDGNPYTLKPRIGRAPWRDVGVLIMSKNSSSSIPASVIRQSESFPAKGKVRTMQLFGLATNNAKYEGWVSDKLSVQESIVFDFDKSDVLRNDIFFVESVSAEVRRAIQKVNYASARTGDGKKRQSHIAEEAEAEYLSRMHSYIFADYMRELSKADTTQHGWDDSLRAHLTGEAISCARSIAPEYAGRFGTTARDLEEQARAMGKLDAALIKLKKGRE